MRNDRCVERDALLSLVEAVVGELDLTTFRIRAMRSLLEAVPADWISLNDLGPDPGSTAVLVEPPFPARAHTVFARFADENPLVERYRRTGDGGAYRFSDVVTAAELHATSLYREFYARIGLEHQIALVLPHDHNRILAIALSRRDHDFSDSERDLLDAARPVLIQAYRNAIEYTRLTEQLAHRSHDRRLPLAEPALAEAFAARTITRRQAEVLSWVATGRSNRAVAELLGLSARTVHKHLEACFQKLGVHSREDAVELAWSYVGTPIPGRPSIESNIA
jgi:DNA-binding CsgD family transcriptional regulator